MSRKGKKKEKSRILLVLLMFAGLGLILYPSVSNYWTESHAARVIADYTEAESKLDTAEYDALWDAAVAYNQMPPVLDSNFHLESGQETAYNSLLNLLGNGEMGFIEIPSLKVNLPIYHGTSDSVLSVAVGHLDWTSLPVGGEGTHCVLSGHRGLPSARLFTDLDALKEGDIFQLHILGKVLTYEVDQILIVEPTDTSALQSVPGKDYCTLLTCTPYGINTHRLLVRGHRIPNPEGDISGRVISEAVQIQPTIIAAVTAGAALVIILIVFSVCSPKEQSAREAAPPPDVQKKKKRPGKDSGYNPPWKY